MRQSNQKYSTLSGVSAASGRDVVASTTEAATAGVEWYWRVLALVASILMLGGFLMLPATFNNNTTDVLRISSLAIGIFAAAIIIGGGGITILLGLFIPDYHFRVHAVLIPALIASTLGLLTVFYTFIVFNTSTWNVPALLTTAVTAAFCVCYSVSLVWVQRRFSSTSHAPSHLRSPMRSPDAQHHHHQQENVLDGDGPATTWQNPSFYDNYNRNMYPMAVTGSSKYDSIQSRSSHGPHESVYSLNSIASGHPTGPLAGANASTSQQPATTPLTEEEMLRQQMLMLLLAKEQAPAAGASQSTFRIEWQQSTEDDDDNSATNTLKNYYHQNTTIPTIIHTTATPPPIHISHSASLKSSSRDWNEVAEVGGSWDQATPSPGLVRQLTKQLRPWDGVWRTMSEIQPATPSVAAVAQVRGPADHTRAAQSRSEEREEMRRKIEMGR